MTESETLRRTSIADLVGRHPDAPVALIGAVLPRFSTYDVETGETPDVQVHDAGDVALEGISSADAFGPLREAMAAQVPRGRRVTRVLAAGGGVELVTPPSTACHATGNPGRPTCRFSRPER